MARSGAVRVEQDPERVRPAASEVFELVCDASLAASLLGWTPCVTLDEGLDRTIEWIASNRTRFKAGMYNV